MYSFAMHNYGVHASATHCAALSEKRSGRWSSPHSPIDPSKSRRDRDSSSILKQKKEIPTVHDISSFLSASSTSLDSSLMGHEQLAGVHLLDHRPGFAAFAVDPPSAGILRPATMRFAGNTRLTPSGRRSVAGEGEAGSWVFCVCVDSCL